MSSNIRTIGVLIGSLRAASFTRRMAHALRPLAPPALQLEVIEIGELPLYNQDLETATPPESWVRFRGQVRAADALLFLTPEYNRSIPSALKNAIDVGSRPKSSNVYDGKPAAVISLSPGVLGGFGANHHLRQCLMCLNVATMPAPEAYIGGADKLFDAEDAIVVESTRQFLTQFLNRFAEWVEQTGRFPRN
jgi:chromate reductase